jgi:putative Mn2+ efflux pump MntP
MPSPTLEFSTLFTIAVALAMDAFAVALAAGICLRRPSAGQTLRMAGAFGLFQALMPVAGWALGLWVRGFVDAYGTWVAFALLALVGAKMIWEGVKGEEAGAHCEPKDPTKGRRLLILSVATSIDALAVGLSFSMLSRGSIWFPAVVIGVICFAFTAIGVRIGCMAGRVAILSRYAEVLGGATLVSIAFKTLLGV